MCIQRCCVTFQIFVSQTSPTNITHCSITFVSQSFVFSCWKPLHSDRWFEQLCVHFNVPWLAVMCVHHDQNSLCVTVWFHDSMIILVSWLSLQLISSRCTLLVSSKAFVCNSSSVKFQDSAINLHSLSSCHSEKLASSVWPVTFGQVLVSFKIRWQTSPWFSVFQVPRSHVIGSHGLVNCHCETASHWIQFSLNWDMGQWPQVSLIGSS